MQEIWKDHHRKIKEIDQAYKRNLKRLFVIVGIILSTIVILL
jgi:hypothetical protein